MDNFNRFVIAQSTSFEAALNEIKKGKKESCWMWYVFPQASGLGKSFISEEYAIKSKEEAVSYLNHNILGPRLIEISKELLKLNHLTAEEIVGFPDVFKLKSSMSLFASIQNDELIFQQVLDKYYNGEICKSTLKFLE